MELKFAVITNPVTAPKLMNFYAFNSDAERAAEVYLSEHPGEEAHVYRWEQGHESTMRVSVDRAWNPPYIPEPEPLPEFITKEPELPVYIPTPLEGAPL